MRSLEDLLNSSQGRQFLQLSGIYTDSKDFKDHLQPPVLPGLSQALSLENSKVIYSGQQLYVDYRQSVLAKVSALQQFECSPGINAFFIWTDTDRSGSDKLITKLKWPNHEEGIRFISDKTDALEIRYVQVDVIKLEKAFDQLSSFVLEDKQHRESKLVRLQNLREAVLPQQAETLAVFNYKLTEFFFCHQVGYFPKSVLQSSLLEQDFLIEQVNNFVNQRIAIIHEFNSAIGELQQKEINPQVSLLGEEYLPLHYTCPRDYRRLRLVHEQDGKSHFATATCKCGETYRFHLGTNLLSLEELTATKHWSLDVCFPIFLNDFVSGYVAGKSSALYGLVLNRVLEKALGKRPIPVYVPSNLGKNCGDQVDSLVYSYFNESTTP